MIYAEVIEACEEHEYYKDLLPEINTELTRIYTKSPKHVENSEKLYCNAVYKALRDPLKWPEYFSTKFIYDPDPSWETCSSEYDSDEEYYP